MQAHLLVAGHQLQGDGGASSHDGCLVHILLVHWLCLLAATAANIYSVDQASHAGGEHLYDGRALKLFNREVLISRQVELPVLRPSC